MPGKVPKRGRKRRTREHVLADLSVHHVEGPILRCGFAAERVRHDYGVDLYMTTYRLRQEGCVMTRAVRYADLWVLLRKLGFNCDTVRENKHRICEFPATETVIILAEYPPEQPVHEQTLLGVRLQLENGGVMSREEFDRWVSQLTKNGTANGTGSRSRSRATHDVR
jgi:hypothetical protein